MKTNHTPGPWALQAGRSIVTKSGTFYLSYGTEKGSNAPLFRDFCELDRNARLIAAAPDLLDALQSLLTAHGKQDSWFSEDLWEQARAAINKAKLDV
jgi:hypothetical protein